MTASNSIRQKIDSLPLNEPFTPWLFVELGSRAAIDQTLMRLKKEGRIDRIGRGVYVRPRPTGFGFNAKPTAEQVARAIAKTENATIEIQGAEAARRFGFSTQMPTQPVYLTSGSSRHLRLGRLLLTLKHVSPRRLALAGTEAGPAMSALWYLGKSEVSEKTFAQLARHMPREAFRTLSVNKAKMPSWMSSALTRYENAAPA